MAPESRAHTILVAVTCTLAAGALLLFARFTAEDAYITARYAENLAHEGALVFNLGERVSALTSPGHALVQAALEVVTGSSVIAWKIAGAILFLVQGTLILWRLRTPAARAVVAPILLLSPCMVLWAVGGMETPLLAFAVTIVALVALQPERPGFRSAALAFVAGGIAFLTRYDSVLVVGPLLASVFWRARDARARWLAPLLGAVLPAAWLVFAHSYYGTILPTSYWVKGPTWNATAMSKNASYMIQGAILTGLVPACALLFFGTSGYSSSGTAARNASGPRSVRGPRTFSPAAIGFTCGFLLLFAYGLATATHHMMFTFRFLAPYVPVAALWLGTRLDARPPTPAFARAAALFAGAWILFQVAHLVFTYQKSINGFAIGVGEYAKTSSRTYVNEFLRALESGADETRAHWARTGKTGSPRILTFAAGALPYRFREAYVYEQLVSYREGYSVSVGFVRVTDDAVRRGKRLTTRKFDASQCSDYLHMMVPKHGTADQQLPKPIESYELVSEHAVHFEGRADSVRIYYDPAPLPAMLPPRVVQ